MLRGSESKVSDTPAWDYSWLQWPAVLFQSLFTILLNVSGILWKWLHFIYFFTNSKMVREHQSIVTNVSSHQSNPSHLLIPGLSCWLTLPVNHLLFLSFSFAVSSTWPVCSLSLACCSLKERSSWGQKGPGTWRWMTWKTMMTISSPPRNHWSTREGWAQRKGGWAGKQAREPSW